MDTEPIERRRMVTLPQEDIQDMLDRAAERGARLALHQVGLDGEDTVTMKLLLRTINAIAAGMRNTG